jgi:hypothetical protein
MGVDEQIRALTEAVQELRDREEIRELFNRYGFSADTGDAKAWSEVYSEDGLYDYARGEIRGRAAFYETIENPDGPHKHDIEGPGSLHTTGALTIRIDGLTAWAEGHTLVWVTTGPGEYRPYALSYSHWDLAKVDGRWHITYRKSRPVGPKTAENVFTAWRATID